MPNFDATIDNRWRSDLPSSWRRVREEEQEARDAAKQVKRSRELSFVPARRPKHEAHDAQTQVLIRRLGELQRLPGGELISQLVDEWHWLDRMRSPQEKQAFLQPLLELVRREPAEREAELVFLLLVFEPVRRGVSKKLMKVASGLTAHIGDIDWQNRMEAKRIQRIEREELYDITRDGVLEAIYRYPSTPPRRLLPWMRETVSQRALDALGRLLPEWETEGKLGEEADALQAVIAGFEPDPPAMRDARGLREWRAHFHMRDLFDLVEQFYEHDPVAEACRSAVGRLPRRQRTVIDGLYFEGIAPVGLAARDGVSRSTVDNTAAQARQRMHADDTFFSALEHLGWVRDEARKRTLRQRHAEGRTPDGYRVVVIDEAA